MKYPLVKDLQRGAAQKVTSNPWEVHTASGLEDSFADENDANFYAEELRRGGVRGVEVKQRRRTRSSGARANPEYPFDTDILEGMARAIWVTSWASWLEDLGREGRRARGLPVSIAGMDYSETAPATPASAMRAAEDLYLLVKGSSGKTAGELFERACFVDRCDASSENAELFGHYVAMQAMDHGVSWFDDHKEFPLKLPRFEAHLDADGEEVWRSPQVHNPGSRR